MVQALVKLDDNTNHVLNVVKAKHGLRDKGEAIEFVVGKFAEIEEPDLKPIFIQKMKKIEKQKNIRVKNFSKRYKLD